MVSKFCKQLKRCIIKENKTVENERTRLIEVKIKNLRCYTDVIQIMNKNNYNKESIANSSRLPQILKKNTKNAKSLNINATILKVLSATFLLICFISRNESTFGTR